MKDDASTGWSISLPPTFVGKSQSLIKKLETAENPEKVVLKIKPRKRLFPKKEEAPTSYVIYVVSYFLILSYTFIIFFGDWFLSDDQTKWCWAAKRGHAYSNKSYENPDYNKNRCLTERVYQLLFLTLEECDYARRMVVSVLLGAAIGFERKSADRPAGIRTMSLVSLGSCLFTMCGQIAFRSSTMTWDAARVSAAVPSGVGFLGAGLIWKGSTGKKGSPDERQEVHGITTAASVWLSAAVGIGAGGQLYVVSVYAVILVILVLRLGPRMYFSDDSDTYNDETASTDNKFSSTDDDLDGDDIKSMSREEQWRLLMSEGKPPLSEQVEIKSPSPIPQSFSLITLDPSTEPVTDLKHVKSESHLVPVKDHEDRPSRSRSRSRSHRRKDDSQSPKRKFKGPTFYG